MQNRERVLRQNDYRSKLWRPYPLIVLPPHSLTRQRIDEQFSRRSLDMKIAIEVGGCFAIKEFVRLGLGVGLVHDICISRKEQAHVIARDLNHIFGERETTLIYKNHVYFPRPIGI